VSALLLYGAELDPEMEIIRLSKEFSKKSKNIVEHQSESSFMSRDDSDDLKENDNRNASKRRS